MEWNIFQETFDEYRLNKKNFGIDDKTISQIKKIFSNWNKGALGYGLKIYLIDTTLRQGLCWKIGIKYDSLIYFLEEYINHKVSIKPYKIALNDIQKIEYLGETKTIRPNLLHFKKLLNLPLYRKEYDGQTK